MFFDMQDVKYSSRITPEDAEKRNLIPVYCLHFFLGYIQHWDVVEGRPSVGSELEEFVVCESLIDKVKYMIKLGDFDEDDLLGFNGNNLDDMWIRYDFVKTREGRIKSVEVIPMW